MKRTLAVVALCVAVYLLAGPPHDGDLAVQTARANLFGRIGLVPWFAGWYAGLHLANYSLTTAELAWWLHPAGLGVACLVATGLLGLAVLRAGRAARPVLGAAALCVFQLVDVLSGRLTFAAGAAVVLAAVLAAETRRWWAAALLGLLGAVTSPVDALVAAVAAGVYLLGDPLRRREGWALGLGAGVGLAVMVLPFPDPGFEPFPATTLVPALLTCALVAVLPVGRRLRIGAVLTGLLMLASFALPTPVGTNAARLPMLLAVPVVLAAVGLAELVAVALGLVLLPWPAYQLTNDLSASTDPAASAAFYRPLLGQLRVAAALRDHRLEVVEPRTHWQVVYLQPTATLARGWDRQLDESLNPLFYGASMTAASYRGFLDRNAVAMVALPQHTPIDFGSAKEAALLHHGLPYLHRVWSDRDWVLYSVADPTPIASGAGAQVSALTGTGVDFTTSRAGTVTLRLRYATYLRVPGATVSAGRGESTLVRVPRPGSYQLHAAWSVGAVARAVL